MDINTLPLKNVLALNNAEKPMSIDTFIHVSIILQATASTDLTVTFLIVFAVKLSDLNLKKIPAKNYIMKTIVQWEENAVTLMTSNDTPAFITP